MDLLGAIIGDKYRVDRLVGTGRFASVYAATCTTESRAVALKVFKAALARQAGGGRRFLRRTRTARKRLHPSIVHIEDQGQTEDGTPYMVMELLEGRTLEQELERVGTMPVERCVSTAAAVLEGLAVAHDAGAVHRNLNPANIFLLPEVSTDSPVRILDLGVAKDLVDLLAISPDIIGRTRYLAPELLLFPNMAWTPSVDVFSLGMVMFLMLTGRLPFAKEDYGDDLGIDPKTISLYQKIGVLPGPSVFVPSLPKAIDEVVSKALSIELQERYSNASEMLAALERARTGAVPGLFDAEPPKVSQPTSAGPVRRQTPTPSIPRRQPPPAAVRTPVVQQTVSPTGSGKGEDIDVPTMEIPPKEGFEGGPAFVGNDLDGPTENDVAVESTQYLDPNAPNPAAPVEATVLLDSDGTEALPPPSAEGLVPPTSLVERGSSAVRQADKRLLRSSQKTAKRRTAPWPKSHKIAFLCACIALLLLTVIASVLIWTTTAP